jgi:hypothetical protein
VGERPWNLTERVMEHPENVAKCQLNSDFNPHHCDSEQFFERIALLNMKMPARLHMCNRE